MPFEVSDTEALANSAAGGSEISSSMHDAGGIWEPLRDWFTHDQWRAWRESQREQAYAGELAWQEARNAREQAARAAYENARADRASAANPDRAPRANSPEGSSDYGESIAKGQPGESATPGIQSTWVGSNASVMASDDEKARSRASTSGNMTVAQADDHATVFQALLGSVLDMSAKKTPLEGPAGLEEVSVPDGFLFDSALRIHVDADVGDRFGDDVYLLVCSEFEVNGDEFDVDYAGCHLNTPLNAGTYRGQLTLTDSVTALLAVLVPLSDTDATAFQYWEPRESDDTFVIR